MLCRCYLNMQKNLAQTFTAPNLTEICRLLRDVLPEKCLSEECSDRFLFQYCMADALNATVHGKHILTDSVLMIDSRKASQNWNRFDHFEEYWLRIMLISGNDWQYIVVRNCEDDYDIWAHIFYRDSKMGLPENIMTLIEAGNMEFRELAEAHITLVDLIEHLAEVRSLDVLAALAN